MLLQKFVQVELINVKNYFLFITKLKYFSKQLNSWFIIYDPPTWICISKEKLLGHVLITNDMFKNVNLDKILESNLDYKELGCIRTFSYYLDHLCKMLSQ